MVTVIKVRVPARPFVVGEVAPFDPLDHVILGALMAVLNGVFPPPVKTKIGKGVLWDLLVLNFRAGAVPTDDLPVTGMEIEDARFDIIEKPA